MMLWISLISYFFDISFSQGSVATRLRCDGIFNKCFIANFLQIVTAKEFQKSVTIWWIYAWNTPDSFFSGHGVQCEFKKNPPPRTFGNFSKTVGNFSTKFYMPIMRSYLRYITNFYSIIQLSATLTKLCHIKRDHPFHIMCARCPPSAETHAGIFWHFPQTIRSF